MDKHLVFGLVVIVLLGCACNESREYSPYYAACIPESFSPTCVTIQTYTSCVDNRIVIQNCPDKQICLRGICQDNAVDDCSPKNYVPSCADDNNKYICNSQNKIEQQLCPLGTQCHSGDCIAVNDQSCISEGFVSSCTDDTHYTVCRDNRIDTEVCPAGTECLGGDCIAINDPSCISEGFASVCTDDVHYTVCRDNQIDTEVCPAGTECLGGDCIAINDPSCISEGFASVCTDDTHYTVCRDGIKDNVACDADYVCLGNGVCVESCSEEENNTVKYVCGFGHTDDGDGYFSTSFTCTQNGDKYYWKENQQEKCNIGCNSDQTCINQVIQAGDPCDPIEQGIARCVGDLLLNCSYDDSSGGYHWKITDCSVAFEPNPDVSGSEGTCARFDYNGGIYGECATKCTADDVDAPQTQCTDADGQSNEKGWLCQRSGENYYWGYVDNRCERGCDEHGTRCNIRHPDEGTSCIGDTVSGCFDGFHLYCDLGTYAVDDCAAQGLECVEINGEGACLSPCTQAEFEAAATRSVCNEAGYLMVYRCNPYNGNDYYWKYVVHSWCKHGCNAEKTECMMIHEDEGKSCSSEPGAENYYASKCDGGIALYCSGDGKVVAEECGTQSCNDGFGCYEPCDTIGIYYTCDADTDGEVIYGYNLMSFSCEEDLTYHIKHWGHLDYVDYCDGANSCKEGKDSCY